MQTGNTLEWRSVASFHKQHHRCVPDIYDLWSQWQHRHDSNPSLRVCPIVTWLNLPGLVSYFPQMKTPDVSNGCQRALLKTSHMRTLPEEKEARRGGHHGKETRWHFDSRMSFRLLFSDIMCHLISATKAIHIYCCSREYRLFCTDYVGVKYYYWTCE